MSGPNVARRRAGLPGHTNNGSIFNSGNATLSALWIRAPEQAILECKLALLTEDGNVAAAARKLGVARNTLRSWIEKHPEIAT